MKEDCAQGGFSLLELLICLLVIAILASASGANWTAALKRQQAHSTVMDLRRLLNFTRYTAIMERRTVTLCAVNTAGNCNKQWRDQRAVVFIDENRNHRLDSGEAVLREESWAARGGGLMWRASLGRKYIEFKGSGGTAQNGTFTFCPDSDDARLARSVIVNRAGRNYVGNDHNGDGIVENSRGENLDCN